MIDELDWLDMQVYYLKRRGKWKKKRRGQLWGADEKCSSHMKTHKTQRKHKYWLSNTFSCRRREEREREKNVIKVWKEKVRERRRKTRSCIPEMICECKGDERKRAATKGGRESERERHRKKIILFLSTQYW